MLIDGLYVQHFRIDVFDARIRETIEAINDRIVIQIWLLIVTRDIYLQLIGIDDNLLGMCYSLRLSEQ